MTQPLICYLSPQDRINFEKRYGSSQSDNEMRAHLADFVIDNVSHGALSMDKLIRLEAAGARLFFEGWARSRQKHETDFCIYLPDALAQALKPGYINEITHPDPNQWLIIFDNGQSYLAPDLVALQAALPKVYGLQSNNADPLDNILISAAQRVMEEEGFDGVVLSSLVERIKVGADATASPVDDDIILWVLQNDNQLRFTLQDPPGYFPYGPDVMDDDDGSCPTCGL